tara:strand:- start:404 stop:541 length:138 start_codon:yes stop_codon:yes gene_type:complete
LKNIVNLKNTPKDAVMVIKATVKGEKISKMIKTMYYENNKKSIIF